MAEPLRLDIALVERDLVKSRTRAKTLIEKGQVLLNQTVCKKASHPVLPTDELQVEDTCRFVSRGGYKLLKAIETFSIPLAGLCCLDVGASTGGFTDCMLQHGADTVYAVDVGTNQLAEELRDNPKVICKEQYNFRYAKMEDFEKPLQFACVDVSFISLSLIVPVLSSLLEENATAVCLIKPQFEVGKGNVGKNGIVKQKKVHIQVLENVTAMMNQNGFSVLGVTVSPIKGGNGNIEYLAYLQKDAKGKTVSPLELKTIADRAENEVQEESE